MLTKRRLQCTKLPRRGRTIILRGCDEPLFTNVPEGVFSEVRQKSLKHHSFEGCAGHVFVFRLALKEHLTQGRGFDLRPLTWVPGTEVSQWRNRLSCPPY